MFTLVNETNIVSSDPGITQQHPGEVSTRDMLEFVSNESSSTVFVNAYQYVSAPLMNEGTET